MNIQQNVITPFLLSLCVGLIFFCLNVIQKKVLIKKEFSFKLNRLQKFIEEGVFSEKNFEEAYSVINDYTNNYDYSLQSRYHDFIIQKALFLLFSSEINKSNEKFLTEAKIDLEEIIKKNDKNKKRKLSNYLLLALINCHLYRINEIPYTKDSESFTYSYFANLYIDKAMQVANLSLLRYC